MHSPCKILIFPHTPCYQHFYITFYQLFKLDPKYIVYSRGVESEDFLGFRLHPINCSKNRLRLHPINCSSSKNRLRLTTFLKPTPDSGSSIFENPTLTPAENMRLHQLRLHNPGLFIVHITKKKKHIDRHFFTNIFSVPPILLCCMTNQSYSAACYKTIFFSYGCHCYLFLLWVPLLLFSLL